MGDPHCWRYVSEGLDPDGRAWYHRCMAPEADHPTESELREMYGR